jgi:hypothetical protein
MIPVLPAFNGVVPEEMQTLFPSANITRLPAWNEFPQEYTNDYMLSSTDPLFIDIGKAFLELQFSIFGENAKSHIYNADTFNENLPETSDPSYLASSSTAVYNSMIAADPDAIWVMQGWMFVYQPYFWTDDAIAAYLGLFLCCIHYFCSLMIVFLLVLLPLLLLLLCCFFLFLYSPLVSRFWFFLCFHRFIRWCTR